MAPKARSLDFAVEGTDLSVSGLWLEPGHPRALYVLAHGAGAGMRHAFMEDMVRRLADADIATLRYQFPYMEAGRRRPDPPYLLHATVRSAVAEVARRAPALPLIAGGKSMGGRMTSAAAAEAELVGVRGLVFLGFPLHPAGKPGTERAKHLERVDLPMLFLQGTRDRLADLELLEPVIQRLGRRATLQVVEGADHGFGVLKRSGRTHEAVLDELAAGIGAWAARVIAASRA